MGLSIHSSKLDILVGIALGLIVQLKNIKDCIAKEVPIYKDVSNTNDLHNPQILVIASGGVLEGHKGWRQLLADGLNLPVALLSGTAEVTTNGVFRHLDYCHAGTNESAVEYPQTVDAQSLCLPNTSESNAEMWAHYDKQAHMYHQVIN